jgi:integrase
MPRSYQHSVLVHGRVVGYSVKKPGNSPTYVMYYRTLDGRQNKRDTNQTSMEKARKTAEAVLADLYAPSRKAAEIVTWEEVILRLKAKATAGGLRAPTIAYYEKLIRYIRRFSGPTIGPADITKGLAEAWKKTFAAKPTRRGKLPSQHTVFSLIRGFSALWQQWFIEQLGVCPGNPWQDVEPPKTDRIEVRVIDEDTLSHFLAWLDGRYFGWQLPRLFIETKAVTGCRLMDLAGIRSNQLRDGKLHFAADQTKGRKERKVPLPAELYARLDAIKGPVYLWESYPQGLIGAVKKMGCPTHRIKTDFVPQRLYHWIETLFIDYGKANPDRPPIHSHQLRKRAFTAAWENDIDPRKAAIAFACNPDTVMKHYVALDEQAVTEEVTTQLAEALTPRPKPSHQSVMYLCQTPPKRAQTCLKVTNGGLT